MNVGDERETECWIMEVDVFHFSRDPEGTLDSLVELQDLSPAHYLLKGPEDNSKSTFNYVKEISETGSKACLFVTRQVKENNLKL